MRFKLKKLLFLATRSRYFLLFPSAFLFVYSYLNIEKSTLNILEATDAQFNAVGIWSYWLEIMTVYLGLIVFWHNEIKSYCLKIILALYPIIATYIAIDAFVVNLDRVPRISDLENFHTLIELSISDALVLIVIALVYIIAVFALLFIRSKGKSFSCKSYVPNIFSLICILILWKAFGYESYKYIHFNERSSVSLNGRVSSLIYYSHVESVNYDKIGNKEYSVKNNHEYQFTGNIVNRRNIYLIVLESFIDPRLLEDYSYDRTPLSASLHSSFNFMESSFSHPVSPSYGGRTAQAEFELLTGLPALAKVNSIEFNVMQGTVVNSFVQKFNVEGYQTQALISTNPSYFNSRNAYRSLGFNHIDYLSEKHGKINVEGDIFLFDGVLFDEIEKMSETRLDKESKPFFFYALGIYGHKDFYRNSEIRPDVVKCNPHNDDINKIANQFYYRTKAIAKFLKNIHKIDPEGIVLVISDHLPPGVLKYSGYKYTKYTNIALFKDDDKFLDITGIKYYMLPSKIWSLLIGTEYIDENIQEHYEDLYYTLLKQSLYCR
jgi:hypothetical protein